MTVPRPKRSSLLRSKTRKRSNNPSFFGAGIVLAMLFVSPLVHSAAPFISLIEFYSTNQITIHFDTEANRKYTLQYTDKVASNGLAGSVWSNLYTAPLLPFFNHYIIVDWRTNKMRIYRLSVTP